MNKERIYSIISSLNRLDDSLTILKLDSKRGYLSYVQASGSKGLLPNLFSLVSTNNKLSYSVWTKQDVMSIVNLLRYYLNHDCIISLGPKLVVSNLQQLENTDRIYEKYVPSLSYKVIKFSFLVYLMKFLPKYRRLVKDLDQLCK